MSRDLTLTIVDGVRVVVPDNLNHATPYVLQEQGDWFEDEIRFLGPASTIAHVTMTSWVAAKVYIQRLCRRKSATWR